ncbi:MAG TPA: aldehyde dehydrogenase [Spirochaetota bacterium]|nr:aldehyde dehydrogenase [Spirochaetota bacterium]
MIKKILKDQKEYFCTGATLDVSLRKKSLKQLLSVIKKRETEIAEAIAKDFKKPLFESFITESGIIEDEIKFMLKRIGKLAKIKSAKTPVFHFKSASYIVPEPYGNVLIISPWNYPFQLALSPLIGAVAAGNCAVIKPSELSPNTSAIIAEIIAESFAPGHVCVINGGREVSEALLDEKFDYIFYTGGEAVGKIVMRKASENLTPVTLELGGKSPCIVDKTADIDLSAKRIVWGKFLNAGQTCVAPDYILVDECVSAELKERMVHYIKKFYGNEPRRSSDYARIINERHTARLVGLMKDCSIYFGGDYDEKEKYISPTIIDSPSWESPVMNEEIFGPLLPVINYSDLDAVLDIIRNRPKPLALYLFSKNRKTERKIMMTVSFGSGAVNDTIINAGSAYIPFGGVGSSGMGSYHGVKSFETFTHYKGVIKKSNAVDVNLRYPPYTDKKLKMLKKILG